MVIHHPFSVEERVIITFSTRRGRVIIKSSTRRERVKISSISERITGRERVNLITLREEVFFYRGRKG